MRNALIVLAAVALVFVAAGAVNRALAFDIDFGVGSLTNVSLFWITLVTAAVIVLTGLVAAWLARSSAVAGQRKLEGELETIYGRLRAAEARLMREQGAGRQGTEDVTAPLDIPVSPSESETSATTPR